MTIYKLNPYLVLDFYKNDTILLTILNSWRSFKYSWKPDFLINLIWISRKWGTLYFINSEIKDKLEYWDVNKYLDIFIDIWLLINEETYKLFIKEISVWLKYKWVTAFMYHIWSSNPNYLEPRSSDWVKERNKTHKTYLEECEKVELFKNYNWVLSYKTKEILDLPNINFLELLKSRKTVRNFNWWIDLFKNKK